MFDIFATRDPQKAVQRANEYLRENRPDAAIKTLEENLVENENALDLHLMLARLYIDTDDRGRAIDLIKRAQTFAPARTDEIIGALSELFYRRASIDSGDLLIQMHVARGEYDEITKVLRALSEREIKLMITRYEKLRQFIAEKKVLARKDVDTLFILASIYIFTKDSKAGVAIIEPLVEVGTFSKPLLAWARAMTRENYNDPYVALVLLRVQAADKEYEEVLNNLPRIIEKFPDFVDPVIEFITQLRPPQELEANFSQILTELHIKKGDLSSSVNMLKGLLRKNPAKADEVLKGLRELQRSNPHDVSLLYTLSDTYVEAKRIPQALSELERILDADPTQFPIVMERYRQAFETEPNNPVALQGMVAMCLRENDLAGALNAVARAYDADPGLADEYILNLNAILERDINNPRALYYLALCYTRKGDHDNSQVVLTSLVDQGEHEIAEQALSAIVTAHRDVRGYAMIRARNLVALNRADEALESIKEYLEGGAEDTVELLPTLDAIVNRQPERAGPIIAYYERNRKSDPFVFGLALARAHAYRGEMDKAVARFEECLSFTDQKDTVKRALVEVIKERPDAVPLMLAAARMFMKDGELEIATQFFKTAQALNPKAFFAIVDEFYDALKNFPKDKEIRIMLIDTFFRRRLWDRVIEEARKGIEVFGQQEQYFNMKLGQALVESGNLTDAVRPLMLALEGPEDYAGEVTANLDKILEIDKSNVPAHFARGRALARAKQIDQAVEEYLLTARIVPARAEYVLDELKGLAQRAVANPKVVFAMGYLEIVLRKSDDGVRHLLQACELDNELARRAIPILEKLQRESPGALLEFSLGRLYQIQNLITSAIKLYIVAQEHDAKLREPVITELKRICAEQPQNVEARKGLAEIYAQYGNLDGALLLFEEIILLSSEETEWIKKSIRAILQNDPTHVPTYYLLMKVFLYEGVFDRAIEVANRLLQIAPGETPAVIEVLKLYQDKSNDVLYTIGMLHVRTGSIDQAIAVLEQVFERDARYARPSLTQVDNILTKNSGFSLGHLLAYRLARHLKDYDRAARALRTAQELLPEKREELLIQEAQLAFEQGDKQKAFMTYATLLKESRDRKAVYRMIKKARDQYLQRQVELHAGDDEAARMTRAELYLAMDRVEAAEKEIRFVPSARVIATRRIIVQARIHLRRQRPADALEVIRQLPVDRDTFLWYAAAYEAIAAHEAAAAVLRQVDEAGQHERIVMNERLAQQTRMSRGTFFIEGRIE